LEAQQRSTEVNLARSRTVHVSQMCYPLIHAVGMHQGRSHGQPPVPDPAMMSTMVPDPVQRARPGEKITWPLDPELTGDLRLDLVEDEREQPSRHAEVHHLGRDPDR